MRLREDPNVNRMHESLNLFKNIINNEFLKDKTIILLLNNVDLFRNKIERIDLKLCFPDYAGVSLFHLSSFHIANSSQGNKIMNLLWNLLAQN
jgi:hypothetical protein